MGMFDWVPSVGEILDFVCCRLSDHEWYEKDGKTICRDCGKVKEPSK